MLPNMCVVVNSEIHILAPEKKPLTNIKPYRHQPFGANFLIKIYPLSSGFEGPGCGARIPLGSAQGPPLGTNNGPFLHTWRWCMMEMWRKLFRIYIWDIVWNLRVLRCLQKGPLMVISLSMPFYIFFIWKNLFMPFRRISTRPTRPLQNNDGISRPKKFGGVQLELLLRRLHNYEEATLAILISGSHANGGTIDWRRLGIVKWG